MLKPQEHRPGLITAMVARPGRPLNLLVAGAVLGLLVVGFGLFRPAEEMVRTVPPGYVALVNGRGILMSDFMSQTETETSMPFAETTPEQKRVVLHEMIDEELLVQRALALDFPSLDTNVRMALVDGVNSQASAPALASRPSGAQLQDF